MRSRFFVSIKRPVFSTSRRRLALFLSLACVGILLVSYPFVVEAQKRRTKAKAPIGQSTRQPPSNEKPERVSAKSPVNEKGVNSPGKTRSNANLRRDRSNIKAQDPKDFETLVLPMEYFGVSEPLEVLAALQPLQAQKQEDGIIEGGANRRQLQEEPEAPPATPESQRLLSAPVQNEALTPLAAVPGTSFEGLGGGTPGYTITAIPPDSTLAVGPNHIVAWVNVHYAVYSKAGTPLLPAPGFVAGNTLFAGMGNVCQTTNRGDPILQYDRLADRWFLSQFAFNVNGSGNPILPYLQCIAVSTTGDPMGTYSRYTVDFSGVGFNDYGKLAVWPDAYYTAYNIFGGSPAGSNIGAALCASDRTKMLAGDPTAITICSAANFYAGGAAFLPADLDGTTLPTDLAQGGIFMRQSTAPALRIIKLKPDFAVPGNSSLNDGFGGPTGSFINIPLPTTLRACNGGGGACIRQPGTANLLDTLGDRLMYRLAYRNRGGVDSLVVTHSVDPDGAGPRGSAARWYEIRSPFAASPVLFQNGTYDPGATGDRWMGSIAMDKDGNMLLGYSLANVATGVFPSIAVAGRLVTDPVNMLQAEQIAQPGTGSQTGFTRWGDYTTMQIDPVDDSTFWFIDEYYQGTSSFTWRTRISSFKFPAAAPVLVAGGSTLVNESCPPANGSIDPGETATVTLGVTNSGGAATTNLVGTLQSNANVLAPSGPQNYGVIAPAGTTGRNFTFTASGAVGSTITLVLQLQDGATNLGTVSYTFVLGSNTACAGAPRISTSSVLSCGGGNTVATITISNSGTATANNVVLTTAKLGAVSGTVLPQSAGSLAPGASSVKTVTFSGAPSGLTTLQVGGTYTGGSYNSNRRVNAPACALAGLDPARPFNSLRALLTANDFSISPDGTLNSRSKN